MYCPRCGKENPAGQRFCNSCGLKLETISNAIAQESTASREDLVIGVFRGGRTVWQDPLVYAFVLIAAGMIIGFFGYKVLSEKTLGDIGTLVSLVGVLLILLKGIFLVIPTEKARARSQEVLEDDRETSRREQSPDLQASQVPLLSAVPPSITEHTTKHLEASEEDKPERPRIT